MRKITELLVRAADLAEAEGRLLRVMAARLALAVAVILIAAVSGAIGVGLLLAAVYIFVAHHHGQAAGAAVTGILALGAGGLLAWLGRRIAR